MKSLQTALGLVLCLVPVVVSSLVIDVTKVMVERFDSYAEGTSEYHYFYEGQEISPWHDIPFFYRGGDDQLLSFVCEIPKGTTAKMEIHKSAPFNRVIQDVKKGEPRHYKYSGSIVNYGAIAQTWEDPLFVSPETGFGGDNDPVDVLQINAKPCEPGEVQAVRVLGCLALGKSQGTLRTPAKLPAATSGPLWVASSSSLSLTARALALSCSGRRRDGLEAHRRGRERPGHSGLQGHRRRAGGARVGDAGVVPPLQDGGR